MEREKLRRIDYWLLITECSADKRMDWNQSIERSPEPSGIIFLDSFLPWEILASGWTRWWCGRRFFRHRSWRFDWWSFHYQTWASWTGWEVRSVCSYNPALDATLIEQEIKIGADLGCGSVRPCAVSLCCYLAALWHSLSLRCLVRSSLFSTARRGYRTENDKLRIYAGIRAWARLLIKSILLTFIRISADRSK